MAASFETVVTTEAPYSSVARPPKTIVLPSLGSRINIFSAIINIGLFKNTHLLLFCRNSYRQSQLPYSLIKFWPHLNLVFTLQPGQYSPFIISPCSNRYR